MTVSNQIPVKYSLIFVPLDPFQIWDWLRKINLVVDNNYYNNIIIVFEWLLLMVLYDLNYYLYLVVPG